jgi:hypothetical protein
VDSGCSSVPVAARGLEALVLGGILLGLRRRD